MTACVYPNRACRSALTAAVISFAVGLALIWLLFAPRTNVALSPALENEEISRSRELFTAEKITTLLEPLFGVGKIKAEVHLDIDFDRVIIDEEIFDPNGQVLRSYTATQNFASEGEYEINKFNRRIEKNGGIVKKMSVLVLIDDTDGKNSPAETEFLVKLIMPAIGFNAARGDTLQIDSIPFIKSGINLPISFYDWLEVGALLLVLLILLGLRGKSFSKECSCKKKCEPQVSPLSLVPYSDLEKQEKVIKPENVWKNLEHADSGAVAAYLAGETPGVAAYVLSRLPLKTAATIISKLEADFAAEVLLKLFSGVPLPAEISEIIEQTLQRDWVGSPKGGCKYVCELLERLGSSVDVKLWQALENFDAVVCEKIRSSLFNFEDFATAENTELHLLFDYVEKEQMVYALRGASEPLKKHLFANMPKAAVQVIQSEMKNLGPVKLREVENAQAEIIAIARKLAVCGKIHLRKIDGGECK